MFTGLVEKVSSVISYSKTSKGAIVSFGVDETFYDVKIGDSIALNGVCLTVVEFKNNIICADIMNETLETSNLKFLKTGDKINLERAMKANSRFDGHIVSGHIDTIAKVHSIKPDGFSKRVEIEAKTDLIIQKGSITINGVSLTVSRVDNKLFEVSLIPKTQAETNLSDLKKGDIVNIEYDILGKYIHKFITQKEKFKITEEYLVSHGF